MKNSRGGRKEIIALIVEITALIVTLLLLPAVVNLMTDAVPEPVLHYYRWITIPLALVLTAFLVVRHIRERRANAIGLNDLIPIMADDLALAIERQWKDEFRLRGLNAPYPLQITWRLAPKGLAEGLDEVEDVANSWTKESPFGTQFQKQGLPTFSTSSHPQETASSEDIAQFLIEDVSTKRLVVLGADGSGKSVLLLRLVRGLLNRRSPGDPVPVLLSISSWDPHSKDLWQWLLDQLYLDHPALRDPVAVAPNSESRGELLVNRSLIFPVLDGLDEMGPSMIDDALEAISDALDENQGIVVSSRTDEYENLMLDGVSRRLVGAVGIILNDLDLASVKKYLRHAKRGVKFNDPWGKVFAAVPRDTAIATILANPLMVALARTIYDFRPGTGKMAPPDPEELLNRVRFPEIEDLKSHLLGAFVPAAYRQPLTADRTDWTPKQADRWFVFLAKKFDEPDIGWWQLSGFAPQALSATVVGLIAGAAAAIGFPFPVDFGVGLLVALSVGLLARRALSFQETNFAKAALGGLVGGVLGAITALALFGRGPGNTFLGAFLAGGVAFGIAMAPLRSFVNGAIGSFSGVMGAAFLTHCEFAQKVGATFGLPATVTNGLGIGFATAVAVWFAKRTEPALGSHWSPIGLAVGLGVGLVVGLLVWAQVGLAGGLIVAILGLIAGGSAGAFLERRSADVAEAVSPRALLARDGSTFRSSFLALGVPVGGITGTVIALSPDLETGNLAEPNGFAVGLGVGLANLLAVGLAFAFWQASWGSFTIARWWFALQRNLPWRLMTFLHDAHTNRGILRQFAGYYRFRHTELHRQLASPDHHSPDT